MKKPGIVKMVERLQKIVLNLKTLQSIYGIIERYDMVLKTMIGIIK